MADPLTALMHAVQVMNFLKTLVIKTLRDRKEAIVEPTPVSDPNSFDDNDAQQGTSQRILKDDSENGNDGTEDEKECVAKCPSLESPSCLTQDCSTPESGSKKLLTNTENIIPRGNRLLIDSCPCNLFSQICSLTNELQDGNFTSLTKGERLYIRRSKSLHLSNSNAVKCSTKAIELSVGPAEKNRGTAIIKRMNSRPELAEAWR